jgi:hypothetical protein
MKTTFLLPLLVTALAGCTSTLSRDQITAYQVAPEPVYARIRTHRRLSAEDVVDLSRANFRSSAIIVYLSVSGSRFRLTEADVENLRRAGVSGDVITYMREQPDNTGGIFSTFDM